MVECSKNIIHIEDKSYSSAFIYRSISEENFPDFSQSVKGANLSLSVKSEENFVTKQICKYICRRVDFCILCILIKY